VNGIVVLDQHSGNGDWTGYTDDGEPDPHWHHGMAFLFVILTIFVNVMLLNVYIGLLSELYNQFADQRSQHFESFRAHISWRMLLQSRGWRKLLDWRRLHRCLHKSCDNSECNGQPSCKKYEAYKGATNSLDCNNEVNESSHVWIAYNPTVFKAEEDEQAENTAKIDTLVAAVQKLQEDVDFMKEKDQETTSTLIAAVKQVQHRLDQFHGAQFFDKGLVTS